MHLSTSLNGKRSLLWFLFGAGNSAQVLAFAPADVVEPEFIGTSAAVVNGIMFLVGGHCRLHSNPR
jgi:hypothetical protein